MARFRVYEIGFANLIAIDLQSDLLETIQTRLMVPLYPTSEMTWSIPRLNPRFMIDGAPYFMATQRMSAIEKRDIGREIANLSSKSDDITAAIDFLFQGF